MAQSKPKREQLPSSSKTIVYNSIDVNFVLRQKSRVNQWLLSVFASEQKLPEFISINFCSDKYLLRLNKKYLGHNTYTDIITFEIGTPKAISADIYISLDRVKENGQNHKTGFKDELMRVLVHGILHLCGYKDKVRKDIITMRKKEVHYLSLWT